MHDISVCSLRSIERWDGTVCITLGTAPALSRLDTIFPDRLALTLSPDGRLTVVLTETTLDRALSALPAAPPPSILRGLTTLRLTGVCMSAAGDGARTVCTALAQAGITVYPLSLCDLGLVLAVAAQDADRAIEVIEAVLPSVPL